jgi:4,5-DOPA dioxygenase extradiol
MLTLGDNRYTRAWSTVGRALPRVRAVLCISAHWYQTARAVTAADAPETVHDFRGFPAQLYEVRYPVPGDPALAEQVVNLLQTEGFVADRERGLDHGAWSVLRHLFPAADTPVAQLSLDRTRSGTWHYELAKKLRVLRDEGVLIVGSGNLVHNLREYSWGQDQATPFDWGLRFEASVREHLLRADFSPVVDYQQLGPEALQAVPSPDHYLPLLYVLAQYRDGEEISFPVEGFDGGSMSMLGVQVG